MRIVTDDHGGHDPKAGLGTAELRLLLRLLRKDANGIARCLADAPVGLDPLADACARSGLSVVLLRAVEDSPMQALLAPERRALLEDRRRRQQERQRRLGVALASIATCFRADGQRFLLLKGPYLAERFYGHPLGREFVDIDLLVPRTDRTRACRLLVGAGFRQRSRTLLGSDLTSLFVHGFDFVGQGATVDLHWAMSCHPSLHIDERRLWSRCSSFVGSSTIDGHPHEVLGDEDEVLFATLSLLRDLERGQPKPKNVLDLIQIVAATDGLADWNAMLAAGDGTRGPLVNVLGACLELTAAHDLAPRLSAALAMHGERRVGALPADSPLHFWPTRLTLGNKLWAARVYDTSMPAWLAWWALSLPFRMAVHHRRRKSPGPFPAPPSTGAAEPDRP